MKQNRKITPITRFAYGASFINIFHLSISGMKSIFNFLVKVGKDSL